MGEHESRNWIEELSAMETRYPDLKNDYRVWLEIKAVVEEKKSDRHNTVGIGKKQYDTAVEIRDACFARLQEKYKNDWGNVYKTYEAIKGFADQQTKRIVGL